MMRRPAALLLAVALGLAAPGALAQPAVEQAKMLFNTGAQAYTKGDYRAAIQAFEAAHKLAPRSALLFSMAQAYRKQYALDQKPADLRRAMELYRAYVAQTPTGGRRADAAQALDELDLVASRLGQAAPGEAPAAPPPEVTKAHLAVSCDTPGAMVSVDGGKPVDASSMIEVEPGRHKLRITAKGFVPTEREVEVRKGDVFPVGADLAEIPARLTIVTPGSADVSVDGRPMGVTPLPRAIDVPSGRRVVAVTKNGHKPYTKELVFTRGQNVTLEADLSVTRQRIASYAFFIGSGAALAAGVTGVVAAGYQTKQAQEIEDRAEVQNITAPELAEYNASLEDRELWGGVAALGFVGALAFGATGFFLYVFDEPTLDLRPAQPSDAPRKAPAGPGTIVEISAAPALSPDYLGAALRGRF